MSRLDVDAVGQACADRHEDGVEPSFASFGFQVILVAPQRTVTPTSAILAILQSSTSRGNR